MGDCKYCKNFLSYNTEGSFKTYHKCSISNKEIINTYFNECEFYEVKNICLNCINACHYFAIIKDNRTSVHKCKLTNKLIDHDNSCDNFITLSCRRR